MPHVHHRAARALSQRSSYDATPQVAARSSNSYSQEIVSHMATTPQIVAIACGALAAVVILGMIVWKLLEQRRRRSTRVTALDGKVSTYPEDKKNPISIDFSVPYVEKPKAVYQSERPAPVDESVGWKPQVTSYRGIPMTTKELASIQTSSKKYAKWEKNVVKQKEDLPPYDGTRLPSSSAPPRSRQLLAPSPPPTPLPSPARAESFTPSKKSSHKKSDSKDSKDSGKSRHRLMKVVNTFVQSLEDELVINIGDTVRLLEEYQDGWCYIQRKDGKKGVVPRFCLVDRPSVARGTKH